MDEYSTHFMGKHQMIRDLLYSYLMTLAFQIFIDVKLIDVILVTNFRSLKSWIKNLFW